MKALLIGINYIGSDSALNGCINDIKNVRNYIGEKFARVHDVKFPNPVTLGSVAQLVKAFNNANRRGIDDEVAPTETLTNKQEVEVLMLSDDQEGLHKPTRANILSAIAWLTADCKAGDKLFLHYSGHGSRRIDTSGDEVDGYDETICPVDYQSAGMIVDDELRVALVDPLPEGVQLRCIFDCCRSGSNLDLPFCYKPDHVLSGQGNVWVKGNSMNSHHLVACVDKLHQGTKCDVVTISGCADNDFSADAYIKGAYAGALTATLMELMRTPTQSHCYKDLYIRLLEQLKTRKYTQVAQLSSGKEIDESASFDLF